MTSGDVIWTDDPPFAQNAKQAVENSQLRRNVRNATATIRQRRAGLVAETPDWQELRHAGAAIKDDVLHHLDTYLSQFEQNATANGAHVHWANDATEANQLVANLIKQGGQTEVIKVKSMATQEIGLVEALARQQITAHETDLAELIIQLSHDKPSHIVVPALHRNRAEIRRIFLDHMPDAPTDLTDDPHALAEAARLHLRRLFLKTKTAISGANFAIAETGGLLVAESEGNGRMCLTLPETLISVVGIEKLIPTFKDLEVFLQLLPRSSTGERMNPYNSIWTGVTRHDGPRNVHVILLDNGRTNALKDTVGRQALRCIRCAACLNVCPVYERTGGHAYGSTYPGPIGAILTPLLVGVEHAPQLPFASSLCGACYEVCPVEIDIPTVLVKLRHDAVKAKSHKSGDAAFAMAASAMSGRRRWTAALRSARLMRLIRHTAPPPISRWTRTRDLPDPPAEPFREWWRKR
ncbi:MAG TPA: LutB/LldF family L-lactate oxidation iron-sulfur protein [Solirubrobacteraceae bacterium]|nr:LutB/LldF family L-lactate oxidation iron-sulfur protein [Solirubrobacteraceae bacterium]